MTRATSEPDPRVDECMAMPATHSELCSTTTTKILRNEVRRLRAISAEWQRRAELAEAVLAALDGEGSS